MLKTILLIYLIIQAIISTICYCCIPYSSFRNKLIEYYNKTIFYLENDPNQAKKGSLLTTGIYGILMIILIIFF